MLNEREKEYGKDKNKHTTKPKPTKALTKTPSRVQPAFVTCKTKNQTKTKRKTLY